MVLQVKFSGVQLNWNVGHRAGWAGAQLAMEVPIGAMGVDG